MDGSKRSAIFLARAARDPVRLQVRSLYNPSGGYATYVVPAVLILILQQTLLIGIGMLGGTAREENGARGSGVMKAGAAEVGSGQGHTSAARGGECGVVSLLGRAAAYFILYMLHILFYLFVVYHVYRFPQRGCTPEVLLFLTPFVLAVVLLGVTLCALFPRRETAMQVLLFTSIPAVFLSGFSFPFESIPRALRVVAYLFPSTAGIRGFLRANQMGADLHAIRYEWWILWGLCAVYFAAAYLTSRSAPEFGGDAGRRQASS